MTWHIHIYVHHVHIFSRNIYIIHVILIDCFYADMFVPLPVMDRGSTSHGSWEELKRPTQLRLEGDFLKRDGEAMLVGSQVGWGLAWFP